MSILSTELMKMYYAQTQEKIPSKGLVFHASLDGKTPNKAETGQTLTTTGTVAYTTFDGIPCLQHTNSTNCWISEADALTTTTGWTISAWLAYANTPTNGETWCFGLTQGAAWGRCMLLEYNTNKWLLGVVRGGTGYTVLGTYTPQATKTWIHIAGVVDFSAKTAKAFLNGNLLASALDAVGGYLKNYNEVRFCTDYSGSSRGTKGTYNMAGCRIYNRALNEAEIQQLAKEFKQEE